MDREMNIFATYMTGNYTRELT